MDALTAKLGKLSKPQIILTAAGAGIAMAIAYRLADRTLDSIIPKKKVEEEMNGGNGQRKGVPIPGIFSYFEVRNKNVLSHHRWHLPTG